MIRLIGAALLMAGSAGFGISLAAAHRREAAMLKKLIHALQEMEWELKYHMPELSELCKVAGMAAGGVLKDIFYELAGKLNRGEVMDLSACFNGIIIRHDLPRCVRRNLKQLALTIGKYDLEAQIQGLEIVRRQCKKDLNRMENDSVQRLRNYQTLAICAGAALAILLI